MAKMKMSLSFKIAIPAMATSVLGAIYGIIAGSPDNILAITLTLGGY